LAGMKRQCVGRGHRSRTWCGPGAPARPLTWAAWPTVDLGRKVSV